MLTNSDNTEGRVYYRMLKSVNVTKDTMQVKSILKDVFNNLAMKAIVDLDYIEGSDVAAFIQELRKVPNLHFDE